MRQILLISFLFLAGCISLSKPVSLPIDKGDSILRASIVKDISFIIRENYNIENDELYEMSFLWREVEFSQEEKDVLIDKSRRVADDWDGN